MSIIFWCIHIHELIVMFLCTSQVTRKFITSRFVAFVICDYHYCNELKLCTNIISAVAIRYYFPFCIRHIYFWIMNSSRICMYNRVSRKSHIGMKRTSVLEFSNFLEFHSIFNPISTTLFINESKVSSLSHIYHCIYQDAYAWESIELCMFTEYLSYLSAALITFWLIYRKGTHKGITYNMVYCKTGVRQ